MFTNTNAHQAYNRAMPTACAFTLAPGYVLGAPRTRPAAKGRSMRAMLTAKGLSPALVQAWLNVNVRRARAGVKLAWPA